MGDEERKPVPFKSEAFTPMQQIFNRLRDYFATGPSEVFQLEWPARVLDKGTYDYIGSDGIDAQQVKPQTVADAEFRLSNDLMTLGNISAGPNGSKLSQVYEQILFNLVPTTSGSNPNLEKLHIDQDKINDWLLEEVADWEPPREDLLADIPSDYDEHKPPPPAAAKPIEGGKTENTIDDAFDSPLRTISRVDLYQKILDVYESQRFRWATFKVKARPNDMTKAMPAEIDNYNRLLSTYAPIVDARLEGIWTLLVVRGQYHRVRYFLGLIDVGSASESLLKAKENLRASVMRSIDDSEDIYPVIFSPSTWAKSLSTAFKPEDLLTSETLIREELMEKQKERAILLEQLNIFKAAEQDVEALERKVEEARTSFLQTRDAMLENYSDAAINAIEMYFDVQARNSDKGKGITVAEDVERGDLNGALEVMNQKPLTTEQFAKLKDMQAKCIKNQSALQSASEALARASLAAAMGRASDTKTVVATMQERITSLTIDINYIVKILESSENPLGVDVHVPDPDATVPEGSPEGTTAATTKILPKPTSLPARVVPTQPVLPRQEQFASVWQEVVWKLDTATTWKNSMASAFQSHMDWSVDFFFGSASGSEDKQESHKSASSLALSSEISLGFRAMKVVVGRPWFDGSVLRRTEDYYRTLSTPISAMDPDAVVKALNPETGDHNLVAKKLGPAWNSLLPSYPTAFIVAKDIHLVLRSNQDWDSSQVDDLHRSMSAGGGFLCFSVSKSESSEEHRTAAAVAHRGEYLSIRIPAPQIIGWCQELTPKDASQAAYTQVKDSSLGRGTDPTPLPNPPGPPIGA
ncbi:hypothetical protein N657DRAFT_689697 [Parathielavia appendiculata]|uniref:Uncharacterized protein n=1 Tax=Parathielavia appendiculata TaxID=2587402 RepID=A0AAN6U2M5_9PEZI|nr:hypothetical protein N657DRAFT_689697 [Parathielavia appendiculata]